MDDDLYDDWDEIAARRATSDMAFQPKLGAYEALAYDTIVAVLRDPATFSSRQTTMHRLEPSMANMDPPAHTPLRRTLIGAFSRSAIAALAPVIERDAERNRRRAPASGAVVDIKQHYAVPLALHTIMRLLRIPDRERDLLRAGTEAVENLAAGVPYTPDLAHAVRGVDEYFVALADERIRAAKSGELPRDPRDPVAALVWAYLDGLIERSEVGRNMTVLFHGGNGTTATLITNAVFALEQAPEQKAKFLARPDDLVGGFVEETLRYAGSTHGLFRTATKASEIADVALREGDRVFCRYGAGSRDPNAFPDPDHFDIERDWSELPQHLGFSIGAHFCLGAPLARAEIAIAMTTLYRRLSGLRLASSGDDRRLAGLIFRGWQALHVTYSDRR